MTQDPPKVSLRDPESQKCRPKGWQGLARGLDVASGAKMAGELEGTEQAGGSPRSLYQGSKYIGGSGCLCKGAYYRLLALLFSIL